MGSFQKDVLFIFALVSVLLFEPGLDHREFIFLFLPGQFPLLDEGGPGGFLGLEFLLVLFELVFGEGILTLEPILLLVIQFPSLIVVFGVQVEPDEGKDGNKDEQSQVANDHIAHVFVLDSEILEEDEDSDEYEPYDQADDEQNILRLQEIGFHHYQEDDVGGLSPCYYLKAVAPCVEANDHEDHEDVVDQENSYVFVAEALILVVFG